jgi:hypothetical protein
LEAGTSTQDSLSKRPKETSSLSLAGSFNSLKTGSCKPSILSALAVRADNFSDGIDLDWEFPSGGGAFYKSCKETSEDHLIPERKYEFDAYLDLVRHIRAKGPQFELSVAVPGRELDPCVDHFNLMSYDAMNRRDSKTAHHSGSAVIGKVIDFYDKAGMTKKKMCVSLPYVCLHEGYKH